MKVRYYFCDVDRKDIEKLKNLAEENLFSREREDGFLDVDGQANQFKSRHITMVKISKAGNIDLGTSGYKYIDYRVNEIEVSTERPQLCISGDMRQVSSLINKLSSFLGGKAFEPPQVDLIKFARELPTVVSAESVWIEWVLVGGIQFDGHIVGKMKLESILPGNSVLDKMEPVMRGRAHEVRKMCLVMESKRKRIKFEISADGILCTEDLQVLPLRKIKKVMEKATRKY